MSDEPRSGDQEPRPDDEPASGGEDSPEEIDPHTRSRLSAQHAAGDLARMGIDPRSLGLEGPGHGASRGPEPTAPERERETTQGAAEVLPLRPEFGADPGPAPYRPDPAPTQAQPSQAASGVVQPSQVEQILARAASHKPAPRNPTRLFKSVGRGLVTPDAAESTGNEREVLAAARQRQTERRIVTFMAGKGGVGTTTVACGVGSAFAALREDRSVLVDVQAGTPSLGALHQVGEPVSGRALLSGDGGATPAITAAGLSVVDGVGWEQPLQRRDLTSILDRVGADHAFTLLDVGNDAGEAAHAALARCDQGVVVTTVGEVGIGAMQVALTRLRQVNPLAAERAVHVVVCPFEAPYRDLHREVVHRLATQPARVVLVPPDPTLQAGQTFDPAMVTSATRQAMLEVGAALALSGGRR